MAVGLAASGAPLSGAAPAPVSVADTNATIKALARQAPRGAYPRAFSGEQSYWTLVGVDGGADSGLISEDGAIELGKGGASVEPFVIDGGRLVTWADARVSQSLQNGYLPIPSVVWRRPGWDLRITTFATGDPDHPRLAARYQLRNLTGRSRTLALALAMRPFQVNGPEQFLNTPGGVSPIYDLDWDGARVNINGRRQVFATTPQGQFAAQTLNLEGLSKAHRAAGKPARIHDPAGLASGALIYRLTLPAHGRAAVGWVTPLGDPDPTFSPSRLDFATQLNAVARTWRTRLDRVTLIVPPHAQAVADTLKTSLAYMLISRKGPMLRPGTRSYDRSWIRDGAMISEALLRLGETQAAADYLRWYAPYQFAGGKVPCCVDARGHDPTPENDSEGEFIFLAAEVYRYGGDGALLRLMWPRVLAAADYMDGLRQSERMARDRPATFGLLPPSISHEGYSSKPAYSYWDDFWGLRGFEDAVFVARALGESSAVERLSRARDEFRDDLHASVLASATAHQINFIPGAADLGDFDATSTTIALAPLGEGDGLPRDLLANTFERNWRDFTARQDRDRTWEDYTPYELRSVGAYVRLGQRDRAAALLDFYMRDRRPLAWNGWAEVVGRQERKPRFIGDMPHAWVASDFARSVLDMFAFDRDGSLVLGAGVPPGWFEGAGVEVRDLRTPYGTLSWSVRMASGRMILRVGGDARPPGGFIFSWPFVRAPGAARFNGRPLAWSAGALRLSGQGVLVVDAARR